jgi:neutral ceramidase
MAWKVGVAEVDITPPIGVWLTGYAARTHPCTHIHDPLLAQALVLENAEGKRAAVVSVDLIALTNEQVAQIRRLVRQWTGIPPQRLLLNCSHTHSAPAIGELTAPWMGIPDSTYLDIAVRKIASVVKMASESLREVRLLCGASECRIGINRRQKTPQGITLGQNPQGVTDPQVDVLAFATSDGEWKAVLFAYACHPVVLGDSNYAVSADYVGYARKFLRQTLSAPALFLQGCAGNINPRERGTFAIAEKLGRELAGSVLIALGSAAPIEDDRLDGATAIIKLPLQPPPDAHTLRRWRQEHLTRAREAEKAGRMGEARWRRCEAEWAAKVLKAMRAKTLPAHEPIALQVLRLGDVAFAAIASETFAEIGLTLRQQSPFEFTIPLGYTNGCIGYLPTAAAYEEGGYEVATAFKFYGRLLMHAPESERLVTDWLLRQLRRWKGGEGH